jgi:hypothetical protein
VYACHVVEVANYSVVLRADRTGYDVLLQDDIGSRHTSLGFTTQAAAVGDYVPAGGMCMCSHIYTADCTTSVFTMTLRSFTERLQHSALRSYCRPSPGAGAEPQPSRASLHRMPGFLSVVRRSYAIGLTLTDIR